MRADLTLSVAAALVVAVLVGSSHPARAADGDTARLVAADPALEQRVNKLSAELRCLVCQNQSLADSNAPLALDLKNQVREQLAGGASERQVIDYLTQRYGDFVLYRPPLSARTLLLWGGPALLLAIGIGVYWRSLRRSLAAPADAPLSAADAARAERLLRGEAAASGAAPAAAEASPNRASAQPPR